MLRSLANDWTMTDWTEENWMSHFQSLHSNERLNLHQEMITTQLRNLEEELALQTHALDYLINETEIRIAVKRLKNNKSSFWND